MSGGAARSLVPRMLRLTRLALPTALAAVLLLPAAAVAVPGAYYSGPDGPGTPNLTLRAAVVGGGKPQGVVEGDIWGTHAMLIDVATNRRIGEADIACEVEKARDKRVIAHCIHSLHIDGKGTLLVHGTHHYKDQTVMPGTADSTKLMALGGTGAYTHASGWSETTESTGGYTYKLTVVL